MVENFKFNLGQEVKHIYLDVQGRIVCRCQYVTNCSRYSLQLRKLTEEGRPQDWVAFDEDELAAVDSAEAEPSEHGGPMPATPPRGAEPKPRS